MSAAELAAYLAALLVILTAAPTAYVLSRETLNRIAARRALRRLELARKLLEADAGETPPVVAKRLREAFDPDTIEQVMLLLLREADAARKLWAVETFERLGLMERYVAKVREARSWSERAHAAEVLGLVGVPSAVPALVGALRDPYEDAASVKASAAAALARIRAEEAIPLLVKELHSIDERSSPRVAESLTGFGPLAVPPLIELLRDEGQPQGAVWAARVLGRIGDLAATGPLLERLLDRNDAVRIAAAEALGVLGDRRATQALARAALRDPMPQVRAHAAGAIGRIGEEDSIDVLVSALADPDHGTRIRALEALEMIRPEDTSALERTLRDESPEVRRRAALALDRVGYLSARVEELGSEEPSVVRKAFEKVLELGRAGLADGVAANLHHPDFRVRAQVARLCGGLGVARLGAALVAAVDDASWPVRARVAEALGRLHPDDGAPALVKLLGDAELVVRDAAAEALAQQRAEDLERFFPELEAAYMRGSVAVRLAVLRPVARFERSECVALLAKALTDPSEVVRVRVLELVAVEGRSFPVGALAERLDDADGAVRLKAIDALGRLGTREAIDALLSTLSDATLEAKEHVTEALACNGGAVLRQRIAELSASADIELRICLSWTLGKQGDPGAVPYLVRFLGDPDARLRASAAGALGKIPTPASLDALLGAVTDRDARTRAAVVNGLGKVCPPEERYLDIIAGRLGDPDGFVRNRAAVALGRLGGPVAERALAAEGLQERVEPAAYVLASALLGTEAALARVSAGLSDAGLLAQFGRYLAREDEALRRVALERLGLDDLGGTEGSPGDTDAVLEQYQRTLRGSQDVARRGIAIEVLAKVPGERCVEALADALAFDPVEAMRVRAAQALGARSEFASAREALAKAVVDPCAEVAIAAARALGASGDRRFADALFRRLALGAPEVQAEVEEALAKMHRGASEAFVDRMMGVARTDVTVACARVLERIAEPSLLPFLRVLLASKDPAVRSAVVRVLARIPTADADALLSEAATDPFEPVRVEVLRALSSSGVGSVERLAAFRLDPASGVRRCLAERLAAFAPERVGALQEALLEDPSAPVRGAAMLTLLSRGEDSGVSRFVELWGSATPEVQRAVREDPRSEAVTRRVAEWLPTSRDGRMREAAVNTLAALSPPELDRLLEPALRDPISAVRVAALRALAPLERAASRQALGALVDDPDPEVREAAQRSRLRVVK